jgi:hypothetical protein
MTQLLHALDEYERAQPQCLAGASGVAVERMREDVLEALHATMDNIIRANEALYVKGVPCVNFDIIIEMYKSEEEAQRRKVIDQVFIEAIAALHDLLLQMAIGPRARSHTDADVDTPKWRSLSRLKPSHGSLATSGLKDDGWPDRYEHGPGLIRGTTRPGRTGGV